MPSAFLVDKETTDYYITSDDDDEMTMRFIPPAPSTSILIVPLGPRLVFMTSCKPFAALMFMNNAAALSMDSAFGFTERREDAIFSSICRVCSKKKKKKKKTFKSAGKCREVLTFYDTKEPTFLEKIYKYIERARGGRTGR